MAIRDNPLMNFMVQFNSTILKRDIPAEERVPKLLELRHGIAKLPNENSMWTFTAQLNNELCDCYVKLHKKYMLTELVEQTKNCLENLITFHADEQSLPAKQEIAYVLALDFEHLAEVSQTKNHQRDVAYAYGHIAYLWQWAQDEQKSVVALANCQVALSKIPNEHFLSQQELTAQYPNFAEDIAKIFRRYRGLKNDPVEQSAEYVAVYDQAELQIQQIIEQQGRLVRVPEQYWNVKRQVLAQFGIEWKSPIYFNRGVRF